MKKILLGSTLILLSASVVLLSCSSGITNIDQEANGESITIKEGNNLVITLESNPTTGYNWVLSEESNTAGLKLVNQEYEQSQKDQKQVGTGGVQIFTFSAEAGGSNMVILNYEREWEEEPIETFRVEITVK
jgi:inhibitor of cysteine peptidase